MELYKENEEIQINAVHIISFPIIAILKIKELNSLHSKLFTKDLFWKKNPSSFVRVLLKNQTSGTIFSVEVTLKESLGIFG